MTGAQAGTMAATAITTTATMTTTRVPIISQRTPSPSRWLAWLVAHQYRLCPLPGWLTKAKLTIGTLEQSIAESFASSKSSKAILLVWDRFDNNSNNVSISFLQQSHCLSDIRQLLAPDTCTTFTIWHLSLQRAKIGKAEEHLEIDGVQRTAK